MGHLFSSSSFCGDILIVLFKKQPVSTFLYKTLSQDFSLQHSIHFSQHKAAFAKVFLTVFLRKITSPQRFMTTLFPDTYERFSPTLRDHTCSSDLARPYDIFSKSFFPHISLRHSLQDSFQCFCQHCTSLRHVSTKLVQNILYKLS